MEGYLRANGRIGIRNYIAVIYTAECSHHVADMIARGIPKAEMFGFAGCIHDPYGFRMMAELAKHPNVGAVIIVRIGCESTNIEALIEEIAFTGKRVELVNIQEDGGTLKSIKKGVALGQEMAGELINVPRVNVKWSDLIIGVECGGSDATSGLSANPATGWAMDRIVEQGGTVIFSELPELLGTDAYILKRAVNVDVYDRIADGLRRAKKLGNLLQHFDVSVGNEHGGLTTIEEKSLGALCKGGTKPIDGVIKTAEKPANPGLYLLDKVGSLDTVQLSYYEENDNDGLVNHLACGAQILVFTTGRGNVIGSVIAPVIKVCGNPQTCRRMSDDMDVDVSGIIEGVETVAQAGQKVLAEIIRITEGQPSKAEILGHKEYAIPYKVARACDVI